MIMLNDRSGALAEVLKVLAAARANVLTINQGIPIHGVSNVSIFFDTQFLILDIQTVIQNIEQLQNVKSVEVVGQKDSN
ncbi:ACT domain-containing protein [Natranaerobius trueperi]|uniref:ACT domain-containing protein n=1 Tax=Natranaerobius trueperi TaxID=759412 RepID=UPI001F0ABD85|nr:ACT domain-containing protein [Natranaerobius trueperi]